MILVIGNKRFSSWSLRPWVLMKAFGIPFDEKLIKLDLPTTEGEIKKISVAGKVPILIDDDLKIWDSLAICEYLAEKYPEKNLWPKDIKKRAWARSVSNEMHSGFAAMRTLMSHDVKLRFPGFDSSTVKADTQRIEEIWAECLIKNKGPYLFGEFSIADAMFAPVVNRFRTYDVPVTGTTQKYMGLMLHHSAMREWETGALAEDFTMQRYEPRL